MKRRFGKVISTVLALAMALALFSSTGALAFDTMQLDATQFDKRYENVLKKQASTISAEGFGKYQKRDIVQLAMEKRNNVSASGTSMKFMASAPTNYAADDSTSSTEKIEIIFKVGDSTLMINGTPVEVETPFVVNGTTMVPVRVITEAFGAQVDWVSETQTVTLNYEDVTVSLQIGNIKASVNGNEQTLLEAPVVSEGNRTMVPLRFISETFGADVGYDAATQGISVVKEKVGGTAVLNPTISKKYVGDSYYKWSMDTPKSMMLADKSFDCTSTVFANQEDQSVLYIYVDPRFTDDNIDKIFTSTKESVSKYTIMKSDKKVVGDGGTIHIQAKDKEHYTEYMLYLEKDFVYTLFLVTDVNLSESKKQEYSNILSTFKTSYGTASETDDLSNVIDGYRKFEHSKYKASFTIPADWIDFSDENKENVFMFRQYNKSGNAIGILNFGIFSKPSTLTAKEWADKDLTANTELFNPKVISITPVSERQLSGKQAYEYKIDYKRDNVIFQTLCNTFMYEGDYAYNMNIGMVNLSGITSSIADSIKGSLVVLPLDKKEIGDLMLDLPIETPTTYKETNRALGFSIDLPETWKYDNENSSGSLALFYDTKYNVVMRVIPQKLLSTATVNISGVATDIKNDYVGKGAVLLSEVKNINLGLHNGFYFAVKTPEGTGAECVYVFQSAAMAYIVDVIMPIDFYGGKLNTTIPKMIGTISNL